MNKYILILLMIIVASGCSGVDTGYKDIFSQTPKEPPIITFIYQDQFITPDLGMNQWDGAKYDRMDTLVAFMEKHMKYDLVYVKNGESIELQVAGAMPEEMTLVENIVGEDGQALYSYRAEKNVPFQVTNDDYGFTIEGNMAAMLSSGIYEPGGLLRGYKLTCSWGDNACEYGFVVRSDASVFESEAQEEPMSEAALDVLKDSIFEMVMKEDLLPLQSAWVSKNDQGIPMMHLEIREEDGMREEDYRSSIYALVGYEFPLELQLIPFPKKPTFHGLVYDTNTDNYYKQKGFIGNVLIFSTERMLPDHSPDAVWATITEKTEIVDQDGRPMAFEEIMQGMTVSNYYRGLTYTTYPGHQGCERLVVDTSETNKSEGVQLHEPMVLGEGGFFHEEEGYLITLEMTNGRFLWGEKADGGYQSGWQGACQLVLKHEDEVKATYDLTTDWSEGLIFEEPFTIYSEDYDNNGITEVLIGQSFEDNSYGYQLYGFSEEEIFRYGGYDKLKISDVYEHRYSTILFPVDHEAWSYTYNNDSGKRETRVIRFEDRNIVFAGVYND